MPGPTKPSVTFANGGFQVRTAHEAPGVYFDGQLRLFHLRCKDSMYSFRVDDAKNLEHLYWGPPLPAGDDITYLTRAHVAAPFDPKGVITLAKLMGLDELSQIVDVEDISDKWKVFTKLRDPHELEDPKRVRRLENASWRLWFGERNKGGDLNRDLSDKTIGQVLQLPASADTVTGEFGPADAAPRPSMKRSGSVSAGAGGWERAPHKVAASPSAHIAYTSAPHASPANPVIFSTSDDTAISSGKEKPSMRKSRSVGNVSALDLEGLSQSRVDEHYIEPVPSHGSSLKSSPRVTPRTPQMPGLPLLSGSGLGSQVDLAPLQADTNWSNLDPEIVGKNTKLLEFSDVGTGDYRDPSFKVTFSSDGSSVCPLEYKRHRIVRGKPPMSDWMPGLYVDSPDEATTLVVEMQDAITGLKIHLYYTVMHDYDIITRRSVIVNEGPSPLTVQHLVSGTVDFDTESRYYMTQLSGGWARERQVVTQKLHDGLTVVRSSRGASSHQFNPFIFISPEREPTEDSGECFGFALAYSGNFIATTEISEYGRLRVNMGINPDGFAWHLGCTEDTNKFHSPELIMSYSGKGMGYMSRTFHRVFRERLIPAAWRYKIPPVLINTWEAAYFNVTHDTVVEIARAASRANIELLVLDDGWFGVRNDTTQGLGDWIPNRDKLPFGVEGLANEVNELGLKFGIWVEPEMVSLDSALYREHSDWCLCMPTRSRTTGRNQLVLDFSRKIVRDHIYEQLHTLLASANIEYVKWDMNRHLTEVFSQEWHAERQGEISHRFILGVYETLARLTKAFPNVLLETCSGGGGRFDPGMLYYSSQIWTSDNTDALSRVEIQYGTSMVYPASSMGAHVSTIPNHQTLRSATLKTRALVAMSGTFGFELDPRTLSEEDLAEIRGYIAVQKRIAPLVYEGDMYRMWSPFRSDSAAWMFVSRNQERALVIAVNVRREVGRLLPRLKLRGLRSESVYIVEELCPGTVARNADTGAIDNDPAGVYQFGHPLTMTGFTLCNAGIPVKFLFDSDSVVFELNVDTSLAHCDPAIIRDAL